MKLETNIRLVVNRQLEAMKNGRFAIRPPLHLVKQVAAVQEKLYSLFFATTPVINLLPTP